MKECIVIIYMDGKRDVLQLGDFHPCKFVADGVLNVFGRYRAVGDFSWFYFPLSNIRRYETMKESAAAI